MASGKFILKKTASGTYRFNLLATNGQVIATSENYKSLENCKTGVESVRKNALAEVEDQTSQGYEAKANPKFEVYRDRAGEYRFRLKAVGGEIIAVSEGYKTKVSCLGGIRSIGRNAPEAVLIQVER